MQVPDKVKTIRAALAYQSLIEPFRLALAALPIALLEWLERFSGLFRPGRKQSALPANVGRARVI